MIDRQKFIGGSDAAAVMGLSPWPDSTPLATYMRKLGLVEEGKPSEAKMRVLRRGKKLEAYVVDTLIEVYGIKVTKRSREGDGEQGLNRYARADHPFLACEVDFEWEVTHEVATAYGLDEALVGTVQLGEVKTHFWGAFQGKYGEAGTDEIPIEYAVQALHGQLVTGRALTMVAVMVGSDDPILYWVSRSGNEDLIAEIEAREIDFWNRCVLGGNPPAPVNIEDVWRAFRKKPASVTEATPEILVQLAAYNEAMAEADAASKKADELKFLIAASMLGDEEARRAFLGKKEQRQATMPGNHVLRLAGQDLLTIRYQEQHRIDSQRLRKEKPGIALELDKLSSFYKVERPRRKKT